MHTIVNLSKELHDRLITIMESLDHLTRENERLTLENARLIENEREMLRASTLVQALNKNEQLKQEIERMKQELMKSKQISAPEKSDEDDFEDITWKGEQYRLKLNCEECPVINSQGHTVGTYSYRKNGSYRIKLHAATNSG
jgi:alanyl-tRNA synthetase